MPRLPAPEEFGTELPRGDRGIVSITPDQSGKAIQDFASRIEKMAEEESDRLDRINTQDALTELSNAETDLAFGENGYLAKREGATKNPEFATPYREQYNQRIDSIAAKLNSPRVREMFLSEAAQRRAQFNRGIVSHVAREVDKAQDRSTKLAISTMESQLQHDPTSLDRRLQELIPIFQTARLDFSNDEKGQRAFAQYTERVQASLASLAARQAVDQNNFAFAEQVLKTHGRIMGKEAGDIRTRLDSGKATQLATSLAADAVEMYKRGDKETDIYAYVQKNSGTVDALRITQTAMSELKRFQEVEKAEHGGVSDELYNEFTDGTRIKRTNLQIQSDPRYRKLPEAFKKDLNELMDRKRDEIATEARVGQGAARERQADIEARKEADVGVQMEVADLLNSPERLGRLGRVDLEKMRPRIGNRYTGILVTARDRVLKEASAYKLDKAEIEAGLSTIKNKEAKTRLMLDVHPALEAWKALPENKGKVPDAATRRRIIANTAIRLVEEKMLGDDQLYAFRYKDAGKLKQVFLPVTRPGSKEKVRVPGDFVAETLATYPHLSEQQILQMWDTYQSKTRK